MTVEQEVGKASDQFYAAVNRMANGDAGPMTEIWSHKADVTAMHPIGGRHVGWDEVRTTWEEVAKIASDGQVKLNDQLISVTGDLAYELGTEDVAFSLAGHSVRGQIRVTNIYRREGGAWKVVHHHTDPDPGMQGILSRLQEG